MLRLRLRLGAYHRQRIATTTAGATVGRCCCLLTTRRLPLLQRWHGQGQCILQLVDDLDRLCLPRLECTMHTLMCHDRAALTSKQQPAVPATNTTNIRNVAVSCVASSCSSCNDDGDCAVSLGGRIQPSATPTSSSTRRRTGNPGRSDGS